MSASPTLLLRVKLIPGQPETVTLQTESDICSGWVPSNVLGSDTLW